MPIIRGLTRSSSLSRHPPAISSFDALNLHLQITAARESQQQAMVAAAAAVAAGAEASALRKRAESNAGQAADNLRAAEVEVDLVSQQNEQMFRYVRCPISISHPHCRSLCRSTAL